VRNLRIPLLKRARRIVQSASPAGARPRSEPTR